MKMRVLVILIALMLLPIISSAGTVEDQLNQLEEQRYQALVGGNWNDLDALLTDDFFYNTATGASLTKVAFVDYMKSGAVVVKRAVRDPATVREYGNVALVTGLVHVDATVRGEEKTLHSRYLHVWVKEAQSWKLAARQATYLPEKK